MDFNNFSGLLPLGLKIVEIKGRLIDTHFILEAFKGQLISCDILPSETIYLGNNLCTPRCCCGVGMEHFYDQVMIISVKYNGEDQPHAAIKVKCLCEKETKNLRRGRIVRMILVILQGKFPESSAPTILGKVCSHSRFPPSCLSFRPTLLECGGCNSVPSPTNRLDTNLFAVQFSLCCASERFTPPLEFQWFQKKLLCKMCLISADFSDSNGEVPKKNLRRGRRRGEKQPIFPFRTFLGLLSVDEFEWKIWQMA